VAPPSERDDLVVVVDQRPDAGVAVVVLERHEAGVGDGVRDAEGAGTVVTDRGGLADCPVEIVVVVVLVFEFRDPPGARAVEDEFEFVLCEFLCRIESVGEATEVLVSLRVCKDNDCCVRQCSQRSGVCGLCGGRACGCDASATKDTVAGRRPHHRS
jgi:hypothetical protein